MFPSWKYSPYFEFVSAKVNRQWVRVQINRMTGEGRHGEKKKHRHHHHDVYRLGTFGFTVPACYVNYTNAALCWSCLVLCEQTLAKIMRQFCVKAISTNRVSNSVCSIGELLWFPLCRHFWNMQAVGG